MWKAKPWGGLWDPTLFLMDAFCLIFMILEKTFSCPDLAFEDEITPLECLELILIRFQEWPACFNIMASSIFHCLLILPSWVWFIAEPFGRASSSKPSFGSSAMQLPGIRPSRRKCTGLFVGKPAKRSGALVLIYVLYSECVAFSWKSWKELES